MLSCFDVINLGKFGVDRPVSVLDLGHGHSRIGMNPRLSMISAFVAWPLGLLSNMGTTDRSFYFIVDNEGTCPHDCSLLPSATILIGFGYY